MTETGRGGTKLTAFRPDAGRFQRLRRLCESAAQAAEQSLAGPSFEGALIQLDDAKGDLTAVWRDDEARQAFAALIDDAWAAEGEGEPPLHDVYPSSSTYVTQ